MKFSDLPFVKSIKQKMNERNEEKERFNALRKQVEDEAKIEYEKKYQEYARKMALQKAREEAMQKSGYAKLRAREKVRMLEDNKPKPLGGFLAKLGAYTRSNMAKNLERKKLFEQRMADIKQIKMEERQKRLQKIAMRQQRNMALKQNRMNGLGMKPYFNGGLGY